VYSTVGPKFEVFFWKLVTVWDKLGIVGQQFSPICATHLGCDEFPLAH
jgi:hypothetical protein